MKIFIFFFLYLFLSVASAQTHLHEGECVQEGEITKQAQTLLKALEEKFSKQEVSKEFCKQMAECYGYNMGSAYGDESESMCGLNNGSWIFRDNGACGMTRQEYTGLLNYMGSLYSCLNRSLYTGQGEKFNLLTTTINSALERFPRYEGFVFRGSYLPQNVIDQHKEGAVVDYPAFTSTSTDQSVSENFNGGSHHIGQMFLIYSKSGRPIMGVNAGEREVLFKAGTKFKVLKAQNNHFIMREVTPGETEAQAAAEDKRILDLALKAVNNPIGYSSFTGNLADEWKCPIDPHNMPEVIKQKIEPNTSLFFESVRNE